jgi:hypothetical protein
MGFCNNAGPAFLFGIVGSLFESAAVPWILWVIQIVSALIVGMILPNRSLSRVKITDSGTSSGNVMESALLSMAKVCGWVIIFRMISQVMNRRFLRILPKTVRVLICGILELTNGCYALSDMNGQGIRFILCSFFLSFGGICVAMQIVSVSAKLGSGMYFPGKVLQCAVSAGLALAASPFVFQERIPLLHTLGMILFAVLVAGLAYFLKNKNNTSIPMAKRV